MCIRDSIRSACEGGEASDLAQRLKSFMDKIYDWNYRSRYMHLNDLIWDISVSYTHLINIEPYKKTDGKTPCTYCEYISICQFDRSLGNRFRLIGKGPLYFEEGQEDVYKRQG